MRNNIAKFRAKDTQIVMISFAFKYGANFVDNSDKEEFIDTLATAVIDSLPGADVDSYECIRTNLRADNKANTFCYLILELKISVLGTCEYYLGDRYTPDDMDNLEYTSGSATVCDYDLLSRNLLDSFIYLSDINVEIEEPLYAIDYEIIDTEF